MLQCSSNDCNSTFHPSCAREANLYTSVKVIEGRINHKAYCRAHGPDQMEKVHLALFLFLHHFMDFLEGCMCVYG